MKQYSNIVSKLFNEPMLMTPARHHAICQIVDSRMAATIHLDLQKGETNDAGEEEEQEITQVGKTVIIPVHGTIVPHRSDLAMSECGCPLDELNAMIDAAEADPNIENVIYDFRSPGGTVTGVPETGRKILHSRKNTIAFTASDCCSGAIWLAAQCSLFYATESSRVGSVGVYTMSLDYSKKLEKDGVSVNAIFAGKYKLLGNYWEPLSAEGRKIMQSRVDKIYASFKVAMESHRMVSDENFGNALTFDGQEAAELGFTDGVVEDLQEVLDMLE